MTIFGGEILAKSWTNAGNSGEIMDISGNSGEFRDKSRKQSGEIMEQNMRIVETSCGKVWVVWVGDCRWLLVDR